MYAIHLKCRGCGKEYPLANLYSCGACGGILEVCYGAELAQCKSVVERAHPNACMWEYAPLLPVKRSENIVTLGEGGTPLIDADRLPKIWGADIAFYIKAEELNPSGSFKDRPTSVGVSVAKELGCKAIVVSSSGNASASAAAYAARAGMDCYVFIPESADPGKVIQAQSHGARVVCVKGNFSKAYDMALECSSRFGWANVTSTYLNPYTVEADKTVAYELFRQLGRVPDYILVPIGSGPLLTGIYKGFGELADMGLTGSMPVMIGVQADQCEPITKAFEAGNSAVEGWMQPIHTIAGGIADPLIGYEGDGDLTLQSVRASNGLMLSLTEDEIADATALIEKKIGLYSEPTGAVSVGAVEKLNRNAYFKPGSTVVSLLTGHGFKFSKRKMDKPPVIERPDELENVLG